MIEELGKANLWTNNKLRDHITNNNINIYNFKTPYGSLSEVILHIIDWINNWLDRIEIPDYRLKFSKITDYSPIEKLFDKWVNADNRFLKFISKNESNFDETVQYLDFEGNQRQMKVLPILMQLSHHFAHHRGQIALILKKETIPSPPLDIIYYYFEQLDLN